MKTKVFISRINAPLALKRRIFDFGLQIGEPYLVLFMDKKRGIGVDCSGSVVIIENALLSMLEVEWKNYS